MSCDVDHGLTGAGDGVLTRDELEEHIKRLERESEFAGDYMTDVLDVEISDARRALRDMGLVQADGVEYLPENCRDLPSNLRRRATELLMIDDREAIGQVTPELIESARRRYRQLGGPSLAARSSRDAAFEDLDALERVLFPYDEE
jgi:hypothetical protein